MNWTVLLAAVGAVAVTQSIFLGIVNIINSREGSKANLYLGIMLIGLGLRIGKSLVYFYWTDMATLGVAIGGAGLWMAGPSLYLYVRSFIGEVISPTLKAILYAPGVAILILGPFYFRTIVLDMPLQRLVYLLGSGVLGLSILASAITYFTSQSKERRNWMYLIHAGVLAMAVMFVYQLYSPNIKAYALGALVAAIILYIINFKGIGLKTVSASVRSQRQNLGADQVLKIEADLLAAFEKDHIYREQKLTLGKVSEKVGIPQYLIRKVIQQRFDKNFNDFVNEYRIAEIKQRLQHNHRYTIEAIAGEVGFTSNSTFYEAFRKVMSCTPAEYRKKLDADKYSDEGASSSLTSSRPILNPE
ncbi:MAG: helix-turn-helix domain-containing protein [Cyclobacteriaceae bacterium]